MLTSFLPVIVQRQLCFKNTSSIPEKATGNYFVKLSFRLSCSRGMCTSLARSVSPDLSVAPGFVSLGSERAHLWSRCLLPSRSLSLSLKFMSPAQASPQSCRLGRCICSPGISTWRAQRHPKSAFPGTHSSRSANAVHRLLKANTKCFIFGFFPSHPSLNTTRPCTFSF